MRRTLLIGLDGASYTVLEPLMAEGVMPRLQQMIRNGARGVLRSTAHPLTPPAWTSLTTGRTPGHHGIFDFVRAAEGEGGLYFTLNASYDVRCETLWSLVSRQGGTVDVLNFPVSTPPEQVNGHIVPGFVPWRHLRRSVHPAGYFDELKSMPGFDARILCMDMNEELKSIQFLPPEEYESWIKHHIERERQWFAIARDLFKRKPATDLSAFLFDGVDKLQHLCWRYLDPALMPADPEPQEAAIRSWCLDYFRELDAFIGELIDLAGPEARIYIASDHGFGPTTDIFYANAWLEAEGYLHWSEEMTKDKAGMVSGDKIKSHVIGIDWDRTSAFALTPSSNGIHIRRPGQPGAAENYEAFRRELADKLLAIRHPRTGKQLIREVLLREEAFPGDANGGAPDLTIILHDYGFLSVLNADQAVWERPIPAGTHYPDGVFIASGQGVAGGRELDELSIIDVAPVLLHSLGLSVPSDMEGRVAEACYESGFLESHPVQSGPPTIPPGDGGDDEAMSEEDEAKVMERLQALGYIE